jgi:altronate hydrolase
VPDRAVAAAIRLHPADDVLVALRDLAPGEPIGSGVTVAGAIPAGHKVAGRAIAAGSLVRKSGHLIGRATDHIAPGAHVHVHNLANLDARDLLDLRVAGPSLPAAASPAGPPWATTTFAGYHRSDGRVGTRNHLLVLPTVNCAATVARAIADRARAHLPAGVDGVWALTHHSGCGIPTRGPQLDRLRATLRGYATHPNTGGVLVIGLGCEVNQRDPLVAGLPPERLRTLGIQERGGTAPAVTAGIAAVAELAAIAAGDRRRPAPLAELIVGLQCGGSDGFSALSANPALGAAADLLVDAGGTVLLSETPELIGAIPELAARAVDPEVAAALGNLARWWLDHAAAHGTTLDANPSPGNLAGGITTIAEKSIGAAAKGGTRRVRAVVPYAERPRARGLVIMDSPGYDPVSATGQIAAGAQVVCFTTGRGSCFGSVPAPALKLSTTSDLARRLPDDIDVDCGPVLTGEATIAEIGQRILRAIVDVASGRPTCSERLGYGLDEFVPWTDGITL